MEARRRYQSAADRRPPADPSSAKGKKAAGTIQASDALPLPIRHTNLLFSFLFMASLFFLMRRWREKVRNSTPLHVVGSLEILSIVSLVASLIYLLSFFGIAFVQSIVSTSDDEEEHQNNQQNQQQQQQRYSVPANPTPPPCPLLVDAPAGQKPKDIDLPAEDEDIIQSVVAGKIPSYSLESKLGDCRRAAGVRREALKRITNRNLEGLPLDGFDYASILGQCCEMPIGYVALPVGIAGPLVLDGMTYYVPMATTEGCLVASTNRGCKAIGESGGATSVVLRDGMTRAPAVRFATAVRAADLKFFLEEPANFETLALVFNRSSRFAKLQGIQCALAGRNLYMRFSCSTGDAMGMNMVSKGVQNVLDYLQSDFPDMDIISISGNFCSDKKPAAVNWIEGTQISRCVEVKLINLSHNSLQGQLPESLGNLRDLEILDVSNNSLSGEIPPSLNNCIRLTELNLSYNDFSGMIPTAGIFLSFTGESFLGNPHLCGPVFGHYCPQRKKWLRSLKFLIMVCVLASVLALLLTICCVIVLRRIRSRIFTGTREMFGSSSLVLRSNYPRITYRELVEATEDFRQDRLVGSGSYGRVYRGVLKDGTVVAVKVLQMQNGNSTRSFNRECQVLKSIRHRNLMKIITACSLPDFKALVLPFMANGSLDSRLYDGTTDLCLVRRVSILSDVAEGMAYLHHHSPVKVIHCDLKPSNVLLNDDMTGLVSDFGIARLVTSVGGGNTVGTDNVGSSTANLLRGSIGYIAPEYGFGSNPSTQGDVYSFGVLVLEVVTRKRPTDEIFDSGLNLHKWVESHCHGRAERVIDVSMASAIKNQNTDVRRMWEVAIAEMIELGLLCTQESPSTRPSMLDVADELDRLKRYLSGDTSHTTATFASSMGMSCSTVGED